MAVKTDLHSDEIKAISSGQHGAPKNVLGPHEVNSKKLVIRTMRPSARTVTVVDTDTDKRYEMERISAEGLYEVEVPGKWPGFNYHYVAQDYEENTETYIDPYIFPPLLTEFDLHLHGEGQLFRGFEKLGAHPREVNGVKGVNFAVWAPNARSVAVIGNFNRWDERVHLMHQHEGAGIWELFIPEIGHGEVYRFEILSQNNSYRVEKSDPYAFYTELRPNNASIVWDLDGYTWGDTEWMDKRRKTDWLKQPMSIYEVHLGSWKRNAKGEWLTYRELADQLVRYVKDMGYTHIELMPIAEHPFDGSWGYQVTGYFAVTSRYGTPQDFMYFVDQCHQNGIGVILDWVPAHFPKDGHALSYFDGTHIYEHADPRQSEHPDWGTYIFNYGRNEVRNFLISNALFWLDLYHIDGLRVDAVSSMLYLNFSREEGEWVPNMYGGSENLEAIEFLKAVNEKVHVEYPGAITIAEESTSWPMVSRPTYLGGLGFTFKWNMGWMHDTLEYIRQDPVYRSFHHHMLTFSMIYAFTENFVLSLSHDEVVHGKGSLVNKVSGDWWQKFATLKLLYGYMYTHPGKKLLFMGQELGLFKEWDENVSLEWFMAEDFPTHASVQKWMRDLNNLLQSEPALYEQDFQEDGFRWVDANDAAQSVYTYMRFAEDEDDFLVIALNFTPVVRQGYRVGVPKPGFYKEIMNSDSEYYNGGNVGNGGGRQSEPVSWLGW